MGSPGSRRQRYRGHFRPCPGSPWRCGLHRAAGAGQDPRRRAGSGRGRVGEGRLRHLFADRRRSHRHQRSPGRHPGRRQQRPVRVLVLQARRAIRPSWTSCSTPLATRPPSTRKAEPPRSRDKTRYPGQGLDHSRLCSLQRRNAFSPSLLLIRYPFGDDRWQGDAAPTRPKPCRRRRPSPAPARRCLPAPPPRPRSCGTAGHAGLPRSFHSRRTDRADGAAGDPPQPAAGTARRARRTGRPGAPAATPGSTSAGPA